MNKETVVGAFHKPSSGRRKKPIHSISNIITQPVEKVKNGYGVLKTLERVSKHYYYIIRGKKWR